MPDCEVSEELPLVRQESAVLLSVFCSTFGSGMAIISGAFLLTKITNSPNSVGIFFILAAIPQALMSLLSGKITGRVAPEKIYFLSGMLSCLVMVLVFISAKFDSISLVELYLYPFAISACSALGFPAINVIISRAVNRKKITSFNSKFEVMLQSGSLISVALAGLAIDYIGVDSVFALSALSFLISSLLILRVNCTSVHFSDANSTEIVNDTKNSIYGAMILYSTGTVIITVSNALMVMLIIKFYSSTASILGFADALAGIGVIAAAIVFPKVSKLASSFTITILGFLFCSFALYFQPKFSLSAYLFLFPIGCFFYGFSRIGCRQLIFSICDNSRIGISFGIANALGLIISIPLTMWIGSIIERHGIPLGYTMLSIYIIISLVTALIFNYHKSHSLKN